MNIYSRQEKMKPQVPDILSKLYEKNDPEVGRHEIKTDDLPEVGAIYRDNTTGIVWKVIAHSGGDVYEYDRLDEYGGSGAFSLSKKDCKRERMVIMQSVEPEGVTMHVEPEVLKSRIHSSDHYKMIVKAQPDILRFEKLDQVESKDVPFWKRGVKRLNSKEALEKLANPKTTSLYVLNVFASQHGLADLIFEFSTPLSEGRPYVEKIAATWLPQDMLSLVPREALLNSVTFRRYLDKGLIVVITNGSAKRIQATPEHKDESEKHSDDNSILSKTLQKIGKK
jgi:hypothetical protein